VGFSPLIRSHHKTGFSPGLSPTPLKPVISTVAKRSGEIPAFVVAVAIVVAVAVVVALAVLAVIPQGSASSFAFAFVFVFVFVFFELSF